MSYGQQRSREYSRELSPEEQARQDLALEAFKEQVAYERSLRRKTVKVVKDVTKGVISVLILLLVSTLLLKQDICY